MTVARDSALRKAARAKYMRTRPSCALCGKDHIAYDLPASEVMHPDYLVIDHRIPLNRGGQDVMANLQPAARACNRAKSDRLDGGPVIKRSTSLA